MNQRDNSIDMLRGLAIFAMIAANMSAHSFAEPHPYWFRIYGSIAAPVFVLLAGFMVGFTYHNKGYPVSYYLKRGMVIVLTGAAIDMICWKATPFSTFDVLYVIGFSLPVARLLLDMNWWLGLATTILIFILTPLLQFYAGYDNSVTEPKLALLISEGWQGANVWKQLLIDGWFPFFPWLGVALAGALVGYWRSSVEIKKANKWFMIAGCALMLAGLMSWILVNPELIEREGYSELFYPPTLMFFATFIGGIFILLPLFWLVRDNKFFGLLSVYGKSSLLMYVLHTVFNVFVFNVFFGTYHLPGFLALYLLHAIILWFISFVVQHFKKNKQLPFVLAVLLGG